MGLSLQLSLGTVLSYGESQKNPETADFYVSLGTSISVIVIIYHLLFLQLDFYVSLSTSMVRNKKKENSNSYLTHSMVRNKKRVDAHTSTTRHGTNISVAKYN